MRQSHHETQIENVVETYVGPPLDRCVFLVLQRTSGQKFAVKLSHRALDSLDLSLQAVRDRVAHKQGTH